MEKKKEKLGYRATETFKPSLCFHVSFNRPMAALCSSLSLVLLNGRKKVEAFKVENSLD